MTLISKILADKSEAAVKSGVADIKQSLRSYSAASERAAHE
jgi:hypothetical protein